ncbi:H-NS histone family protein [Paraburkholderia sp. EG287A]|uniref:H-NS histone family protein n=1 Tax=Paraburkholderia sp. EG287A TaxID=3237012 RepID=UPI0034D18378
MANLDAIQAKIKKLQREASVLQVKTQRAAIKQIHEIMLANKLTLAHIPEPKHPKGAAKAGRKAAAVAAPAEKGKLPAKYLNPKTGQTWSGHARPPAWIADVKDRSKFLIANGAAADGIVKKGANANGAKVKATLPKTHVAPKYKDPDSGATWSGRGRAPLWIADAEDRSKFLIA